jgi:hypothetical protein
MLAAGHYRGGGVRGIYLGVGLLACVAGCARQGEIVLSQPFAPPAQRELKLRSSWTFSQLQAGRRNCVLAFPRPGMPDGPRDFLLYVSLPARDGQFVVAGDAPQAVRGFMIQAVGELRGKAMFTAGSVRVSPVWLAPHQRRLELSLRCDDGTGISGAVVVEAAPAELHSFQRRYAADIALLEPAAEQPSERTKNTGPRRSTAP